MKYLDKIKRIFFTQDDLGVKILDPLARQISTEETIIARGAQSQLLMANPVFHDVITDMYLSLEAQLDWIEDTEPDAQSRIQWIRLQRRALRTIAAQLDNSIAAMEQINQQRSDLDKDTE
jgi:hypothetical protein